MSRTSIFTTVTPLPQGITRQSVMETFHNHIEMIELNPLVVERFACKPPSYAPSDEFYQTWYTIKDKVNYLPGGLYSGSVSYHAVFHDLPDGLQTHVYAPLGLDIQAKWSVGGSLPGEPKQTNELGLDIPRQGLYVREDVKMKCNIMMMSFVKKTFKESHAKLVEHLVEKAHMIESSVANERLKALREVDPGERMGHGDIFIAPPPGYQPDPAHLSMYSTGSSSSHSPVLSQSSTLTSQSANPMSPPYHAVERSPPYHAIDERHMYYSGQVQRAASLPHNQLIEERPRQQNHQRNMSHQVSLLPSQAYKPPGSAPTPSLLPSTSYKPPSLLPSTSYQQASSAPTSSAPASQASASSILPSTSYQQASSAPVPSLLPSTSYDPNAAPKPATVDFKDSAYMYNAMYNAACLDPTASGPPVPPKDKQRHVVELSG
ncbi:hypothetical protein K504DRAFT_454033 [Pleomassaria siparia CBS 279.74]|uniref:DUF7053 domain-containing protein n=1 Tax=Pleomassaria siparia CBS 279.74 TaxID=1314801 RepID=A0A6G1KF83_9PLEO|nr:hypothetical protein K504DRAFT_454033 [Pleomassaria siparia CBS 279.74]